MEQPPGTPHVPAGIDRHYPPEPIAQFTSFTTTGGFCFLKTAVMYFPEDVLPVIRNLTSEQIKELTNAPWNQSH